MVPWKTLDEMTLEFFTEKNPDLLLKQILTSGREITSADAGSLYLVEESWAGRHLVFKLTQNDSYSVPFRQFTMPIDTHTLSGYVAATKETLNIEDAYHLENLPFRLNRDFDEKFGYRTKSMLVVPMLYNGDVIGVLQLINAKTRREFKLTSPEAVAEEVISFSQLSQELVSSLAAHAAVALEDNLIHRDVEKLIEGFVHASLTLIESRDPATFGHSMRVAKLTVALAEAVDRMDSGPYKDIRFTREDIREIRYASLLHDIGNIGVREEVLVKANELNPSQMDLGLNTDERQQIESHVVHTFRFLAQIPWTKELRRVPEIARAHHEKLDGSGYPYHMKAEEIPFQSKMMTIADIFDTLTACDRPWSRAIPVPRALEIMREEVRSKLLDPDLFQIFLDSKVYEVTARD